MEPLRLRLFVKALDSDVQASELTVNLPTQFAGFPGKPLPPDMPPVFQATASFPGVLPDDGMAYRDHSSLVALIRLLNSVEQFCVDFEKAGGTLYFAMPDDENKPFLGEAVKAKRFFRL
jgi:hypothetical protein